MRIRACFASSVPILEPRALISFRMRLELDPDLTPDYRQVGVVPGRFAEVSDGAHEHERGRPAVGTVLAAQPAAVLVEVPPFQVLVGDLCFNFFPGVNAHDLLPSRRRVNGRTLCSVSTISRPGKDRQDRLQRRLDQSPPWEETLSGMKPDTSYPGPVRVLISAAASRTTRE